MAEHRYVVIDNAAVKRAEVYIDATKRDKGIRLSIGTVFAMALDKMLKNEKMESGTGV